MGVYFVVQKILYYFMVHVYLYLHPKAFLSWRILAVVILLNIVICVGVTVISGRTILKEQIIEEIGDFFEQQHSFPFQIFCIDTAAPGRQRMCRRNREKKLFGA